MGRFVHLRTQNSMWCFCAHVVFLCACVKMFLCACVKIYTVRVWVGIGSVCVYLHSLSPAAEKKQADCTRGKPICAAGFPPFGDAKIYSNDFFFLRPTHRKSGGRGLESHQGERVRASVQ